jgi:hypothetical protein
MTERTVTEGQVIDAMNKHSDRSKFYSELFPDRPKVGELIAVLNHDLQGIKGWYLFVGFYNDGRVIVLDNYGEEELWENYRRQTPEERGEG